MLNSDKIGNRYREGVRWSESERENVCVLSRRENVCASSGCRVYTRLGMVMVGKCVVRETATRIYWWTAGCLVKVQANCNPPVSRLNSL